jgi:hypothetical protein
MTTAKAKAPRARPPIFNRPPEEEFDRSFVEALGQATLTQNETYESFRNQVDSNPYVDIYLYSTRAFVYLASCALFVLDIPTDILTCHHLCMRVVANAYQLRRVADSSDPFPSGTSTPNYASLRS